MAGSVTERWHDEKERESERDIEIKDCILWPTKQTSSLGVLLSYCVYGEESKEFG